MEELEKRFRSAKDDYLELISNDFPDFRFGEYIEEKAQEASQADIPKVDQTKKTKLKEKIASTFDVSNDGKISATDFTQMPGAAAKSVVSTIKSVGEKASKKVSSFNAAQTVSDSKDAVKGVGKAIANTDVSEFAGTASKIGKTAVGVQGIQDRSSARRIQEICGEYYEAAEAVTEEKRQKLNYAIADFGEYRLRSLHETVGRFLQVLRELKQKNATKEYEILLGTDIDIKTLDEMEHLDMAASEALRTTAITGAFGAAAVMGTPVLVTGAVGAIATASTGTAISTLSGAAANSAILAWLGGGSLATGGGGMAAGAMVLTGLTAGATTAVAILSAGIMVSMHYGKKLTQAKEYEKDVGVAVANLEKAWVLMEGISLRTTELRDVTEELRWKTIGLLKEIDLLIPSFDFANKKCVTAFNKCAQLIKAMVELAQAPLLDGDGNLSAESMSISGKTRKIMNTEV